jgi:hypothetical protein
MVPGTAVASGPALVPDRSGVVRDRVRTVRSWPLLLLAFPAAAEVWSGWVGIAQKTGFGLVHPLPGIWPSLHLDTTITLPIGVEAYAAYALRAWLATGHWISPRTRQFAKWSAICSFLLGMAGQVTYHLLAQAEVTRAPWAITTIVSCLPVLVLAMGTTLAHMLRDDATTSQPQTRTTRPATPRSPDRPSKDQAVPDPDQTTSGTAPPPITVPPHRPGPRARTRHRSETRAPGGTETDRARLVASELATAGKPVSRRALRSSGIRGSNEALNALALMLKAETANPATPP